MLHDGWRGRVPESGPECARAYGMMHCDRQCAPAGASEARARTDAAHIHNVRYRVSPAQRRTQGKGAQGKGA
jgi:hypothetical protein